MDDSIFFKRHGVTYSDVIKVSSESLTGLEAARKLGLPHTTYINISRKLKCQVSNRGGKGTNKNTNPNPKYPLNEVLQGLHPTCSTGLVKYLLLKEKIKEWKCEKCGITEWLGERIALELDHINGNNSDHKLENLRILCPNCHSQTDTYRSKNRKNKIDKDKLRLEYSIAIKNQEKYTMPE